MENKRYFDTGALKDVNVETLKNQVNYFKNYPNIKNVGQAIKEIEDEIKSRTLNIN